jgi:hypothetical protein
MDDNTILILVVACAGLLTAIGASIRHIYKCHCCCVNSKCNAQNDEEQTAILNTNLNTKSNATDLDQLPQTIQDTIKTEIGRSMTNLYMTNNNNDVFYPIQSQPINIPSSPRPPRRSKHQRLPSISDPTKPHVRL